MAEDSKHIVSRIGETDQLYLAGNSPELSLERAELRMQLVTLSHAKAEQVYFLQETVVILEQARVEFEEMALVTYLELSIALAKAYMLYFEVANEQRFALITQQILRPLVNLSHGDIYFYLAYASISKNEVAMTRHWLNKYAKSNEFDILLMKSHPAFTQLHNLLWFQDLGQSRLH